jgi:uncharacterized protein YxjI
MGVRRPRRSKEAPVSPAVASGQDRNRYRMLERLAAIGDDFFIQNDAGQRVFKVDGKAIRMRNTLRFEDMRGKELCTVQAKVAYLRDTMDVTGPNGERLASVRKQMISPVRDRFTIDIAGGPLLEVQGNVVAHEFSISSPDGEVAEVSRWWFRPRDSYGVEVAPGQNDVVILAAVVTIDQMISDVR